MSKETQCHYCGSIYTERIGHCRTHNGQERVTRECSNCKMHFEVFYERVGTAPKHGNEVVMPEYIGNHLKSLSLERAMMWFIENVSEQPWRNEAYRLIRDKYQGE